MPTSREAAFTAMMSPATRWKIAVLLALGVLVNYLDRVNLTVAHGSLERDFHVSYVTFGWLLSTYNFAYAICQIPIGLLLDHFGVRRLGIISAALVTMASFLSAVSPSLGFMFASRILLGVGESPLFPGSVKAVGLWFPAAERSRATSLFDSMAKLASGIGVPIIGFILLRAGWRSGFAFTGLCTLGYLGMFARWYRDPLPRSGAPEAPDSLFDTIGLPLTSLLQNPQVLGMALVMLAYNYAFYLTLAWLPTFLVQKLHIEYSRAFFITGIPWLFATAVEIAAGGYLTDWIVSRSSRPARTRLRIIAFGLSCGVCLFAIPLVRTPFTAVWMLSLAIGGNAAATPCMWTAPSLIAPRSNVATVGGIMNFSGQIGGITAPVITGYLVSDTKSFNVAFAVAGTLLLVGVWACFALVKELAPLVNHREHV
jgi:MFS transporter, ACS family, D-galactonate transporter